MASRKRKGKSTFGLLLEFVEAADTIFEKFTGKPIADYFRDLQQQPREIPSGEQTAPQQGPTMTLADAYAVLGLPQTASLKEVKENYGRLAFIFHPDRGGHKEAMVLLNQAYERIRKEKGE